MSFTFKQFNAYLDAPLEDQPGGGGQLDEIFGMFKSDEEKEKAEMEKLQLLAKRGDLKAKAILAQKVKDAEKVAAAKKAAETHKARTWADAQASQEARDRGTSRAYDRETGSVKRGPKGGMHGHDQLGGLGADDFHHGTTRKGFAWSHDAYTGGKSRD